MAQARRDYGDGSIHPRKDGRWAASLRLENGKRKYFYGKDKKEVKAKLEKFKRQQEQGIAATEATRQTVQQYLEYWLSIRRKAIKDSSYVAYSKHMRLVYPIIGHVKLEKLTVDRVQALYHTLQEDHAPYRIRVLHTILSSALSDAVKWKRLSFNPCKDVTLPRAEKHAIVCLTPEQAERLMDAARETAMECLLMLAITTGMRRGELLALRWNDINLENKSLSVKHTVSYLKIDENTYRYIETEPKTDTSKRQIMLPSFVVDALKAHRTQQIQARWQANEKWQDQGFVFCNRHGGYFSLASLYRRFARVLERAGLPDMRFHDLRHSAATILLVQGVHPKIVQELLGHSSIQITLNIYSHVLPTMQRTAMDELDTLYRRAN